MEALYHCDAPEKPDSVGEPEGGSPASGAAWNERGIALVTALMLTLLSMGVALALLYLIVVQTKVSGAHKRYKNSLEASHGGVQLITKELIPRMFGSTPTPGSTLKAEFASIGLDLSSDACMGQKLSMAPSGWLACGPQSKSIDPKTGWDMTFNLAGTSGPGFKVYSKIVDTQPGNSDTTGIDFLESGAGVTGVAPGVSPKHVPAVYRIEAEGESMVNPNEKAALTVLYSY